MAERQSSILVVDDDPAVSRVLAALLTQSGFRVHLASGAPEALAHLARQPVDVVLSDVRMPGMSGMELLAEVGRGWRDVPVILLTAHGTVPLAVEAMRAGAVDFVLKPFDRDELVFTVRKALTRAERQGERASLSVSPVAPGTFVGSSRAMAEVQAVLARAAAGTATVLLRGESGTGKELAALAVHEGSARRAGPLVKVHCAALPEALLESELFGHEKGAFTGAAQRKPGRVELAHGGTLFLDEVGELPLSMQVKLLRVLQEREFERVGGTQTLKVDVRFVAATHRPLEEMVQRGQFREDLFYRLNVVPVWLPPLRERPEDIAPLTEHLLAVHARANGRPELRLGADALALLQGHAWPGNVRQLQNFLERLVVLSPGPLLTAADVTREWAREPGLPVVSPAAAPAPAGGTGTLEAQRQRTERAALEDALARAANNRSLAARLLGVSRRTLYYKLEEHGLLEHDAGKPGA